jgi:hypothetical protein
MKYLICFLIIVLIILLIKEMFDTNNLNLKNSNYLWNIFTENTSFDIIINKYINNLGSDITIISGNISFLIMFILLFIVGIFYIF